MQDNDRCLRRLPSQIAGELRPKRPVEAVFLDRDGTLNVERADYVKSIEELVLLPGVLDALARLATFDLPLILITNQSAIGRGIVSHRRVERIHHHLRSLVHAAQGRIDAIYLCPHPPDAGCDCRKPKPGLLQAAANDWQLDLARCAFIGDSMADLGAARTAGCQPILVRTGRQAQQLDELAHRDPTVVLVNDLSAAVDWLEQWMKANSGEIALGAQAHSSSHTAR
ncbi:MAG: D-glycero-beta-D-manno-heptose 1,7-bisphosphate 7-phosphatase [Caldilinea sp.]|nr:D-glycero-beta-D-manno-heptose 1,7-bisphosphate 7-phosphatase [Caldilinea sp.]MDW8439123.1 D-glycero-beta-D-manno-heptose 1,7-bisphosphate 7-phosphatase [Caldilineaceae bacterium]